MLRKFFILAFLSASFTIWATPCSIVFPQLQISDSVMKCRLDTLRFEPQASLMYLWSDSSTNPYFIVRDTEIIWVEISDSVGINTCKKTISIHLFPIPEITTPIDIDTILCFGDTLTLNAVEPSDATFVRWEVTIGTSRDIFPDSTLNIIFDSSNILINDSSRNLVGHPNFAAVFMGYCAVNWIDPTDTVRYTVRDTALVFFARSPEVNFDFSDTIACFDFDLGGFELVPTFNMAHSDAPQYDWIWNNQNKGNENTFVVPYENQGMQFVEVRHRFCYGRGIEGYSAKDSVDVRFWDRRWISPYRLISDTLVCNRGIRVSLNATAEIQNTTYEWSGPGITDTLNPIQTVYVGNFTGTGNFTVILRDSAGCQREVSVDIRTEFCDPSLEMPNVFTPNGDGVNDYFRPTLFHRVYNFHLRVYNRSGRIVYEFEATGDFPSEQEWPGWNGRIGGTGSEAPEGVYFWAVRYDDIWGRRHREQGTITLLR
ncbi:MAG: gliding motility-associated C-terminal domain-containing protein [Bacteroidales bacterium]|nr:gliding motility-associated C-terminal domain-containing protein [Bacteroidales bacterium]